MLDASDGQTPADDSTLLTRPADGLTPADPLVAALATVASDCFAASPRAERLRRWGPSDTVRSPVVSRRSGE